MDRIKKIFSKDKFAAHAGIELLEVTPGKAKAKMKIKDFHCNGAGSVHGGAIFTLADFCFAAAANSRGTLAVALDCHVSFVTALLGGVLYAQATETSFSEKIATYSVRLSDEKDTTIALFEGMAFRKKQTI